MQQSGIKQTKIADLNVSQEFKNQATAIGLVTLHDAVQLKQSKLKSHPAFDYLWYADLLELLKDEGLLEAFQE